MLYCKRRKSAASTAVEVSLSPQRGNEARDFVSPDMQLTWAHSSNQSSVVCPRNPNLASKVCSFEFLKWLTGRSAWTRAYPYNGQLLKHRCLIHSLPCPNGFKLDCFDFKAEVCDAPTVNIEASEKDLQPLLRMLIQYRLHLDTTQLASLKTSSGNVNEMSCPRAILTSRYRISSYPKRQARRLRSC